MRKSILSLILSGVMVLGVAIPASAEWRYNSSSTMWSYYDGSNNIVKDQWVNYEYWVDSNGMWSDNAQYLKENYNVVFYNKETGEIKIYSDTPFSDCLITTVEQNSKKESLYPLYVRKDTMIDMSDVCVDYKVILDVDGLYKVVKTDNN